MYTDLQLFIAVTRSLRKIAFLPLILVSCSPFQKVTLSNFEEYEISCDQRKDLQYVLRKNKLHFSDIDRRYIINNYEGNESEAYESHNIQIDDHVVIPKGASGICVHSNEDHFVVDFGKEIFVPFIVLKENNKAKAKIVVGKRVYRLEAGHRNARLYFDSRALRNK